MSEEGARGEASDSTDSLMRELARAPEAPPPNEPERLGRFRITGRLGAGGMGVVYRAEDEALHRTVALKVVRPSLQGDVERRKRLVREARAAAAVTHPNIAAVYEIGESDGRIFIAMEYVEGPTLRSLLAGGAMPLPKALPIALQIAEGLAKVHRAGIVHRDVKPENVIVSVDGHAKLLDFGLVKLRASDRSTSAFEETVTADGQIIGTPAYASPEQVKGDEVGPAADVFAFGVTIYELVTSERPFAGSSILQRMLAIERDAPKPASSLVPELSPAVDSFLAKCLAKEPRERFANGDELVAAIASLQALVSKPARLGGSDVETGSDVTAVRPPRDAWTTRSRTSPWIAVSAIVALVLGAIAYGTLRAPVASGGNSSRAPSTSATAPRTWVRMTERPPPKSSSPGALAAYRIAMQDLRDGSIPHAQLMLNAALKEDPELAAAHLRHCLHYTGNNARLIDELGPPAHYRRAVALREMLDDHDRELLGIADAIYANAQRDLTVALTRAREARARFPEDEEIALEAAALQSEIGGPSAYDAMRDLVSRAAPFALAEWYLLNPSAWHGDWEGWRAAGARCIAGTPHAASCLGAISLLYNAEGDCEGFEAIRRRRVSIDPESPLAHRFLGLVLAANGAPDEVAFEEFRSLGDRAAALARALVYLRRGEFSSAEPILASVQAEFEKNADDDVAGDILVLRALAAEESGDRETAVEMAKRAMGKPTVRNGSAFRENRASSSIQAAVGIVYRAGGLPSSRALDFEMPLPGAPLPSADEREATRAGLLAEVAEDEASARAALEALRNVEPHAGGSTNIDTDVVARFVRGRARWLTGDAEGAIADLEIASQYCLSEENPFASPRAALLLGVIREAQHDEPAACAAYARVLGRWGTAKPRSLAADKARARRKALGCTQ